MIEMMGYMIACYIITRMFVLVTQKEPKPDILVSGGAIVTIIVCVIGIIILWNSGIKVDEVLKKNNMLQ